jgi:hypothetical protein
VDRIYASYFPLVPAKDTCFELGRVLMSLRDYSAALELFHKSGELCGQHHVTWCVGMPPAVTAMPGHPALAELSRWRPSSGRCLGHHLTTARAGSTRASAATTSRTTTGRWSASRCARMCVGAA